MSIDTSARFFADTWGMHDVGAGWWILMMALMILFWGLVVAGVVWLVRGAPESRAPFSATRETPLEILDRRLAAGEISPEEYADRRRLLDESPQAPDDRAKERGSP